MFHHFEMSMLDLLSQTSHSTNKVESNGSKRFFEATDSQLEEMSKKKFKKNKVYVTKTAVSTFTTFCKELGLEDDIHKLSKEELGETLKKLYVGTRKTDGELYKLTAFNALRYGLSRNIESELGWSIIRDVEFKEADVLFGRVCDNLKTFGKGKVDHHDEIEPEDLLKLYGSFDVTTPTGLQEKIWFDLCLQLCRRGRENMKSMTKETFAVATDDSGRKFVYEVEDEADKNHDAHDNSFDTIGEGTLSEVPGHPLCLVKTFQDYISKLHPDEKSLWQRPSENVLESSTSWFCRVPVGEKALGKMMATLSAKYSLSKRYTNHCVRVTSLQLMDDDQIPGRHIIRVSGHKSEASIKSYARKLSAVRKKQISDTFNKATGIFSNENEVLPQEVVPTKSAAKSRKKQTELAIMTSPLSSLENFDDLDECNPCLAGTPTFLEDVEKVESSVSPKLTPSNKFMSSVMSASSTAPVSFAPSFSGCHTVSSVFISISTELRNSER